jgi:hypothetical protein
VKLSDAQRSHLEELLHDRPEWFKTRVWADIAAEERRDDDDENAPCTGLSAYTLVCLECELASCESSIFVNFAFCLQNKVECSLEHKSRIRLFRRHQNGSQSLHVCRYRVFRH